MMFPTLKNLLFEF
ncbi:hypothetical protein LINPERPRIM_LOCUS30557 [Linum perenne]